MFYMTKTRIHLYKNPHEDVGSVEPKQVGEYAS